jgi:divalent metal cation (Fe/Co/Zn/Cd) transporter
MPESSKGTIVDDRYISERIRSVVRAYPDVIEISAITTYATEGKLHINVHCLFAREAPISELHKMISQIEESVRQKISNAIVTIHPEPSPE